MPATLTTQPCRFEGAVRSDSAADYEELDHLLADAIKEVHAVVPPLWPLNDYVAVNPFFGLANMPFLNARQSLSQIRNCDLLMPFDYYRTSYQSGTISREQVTQAHDQCVNDHAEWFDNFDLADLFQSLQGDRQIAATGQQSFRTVADAVDSLQGSSWKSHILNDMTRHCSTHYDEGHALWSSPWKNDSLYDAWREAAKVSYRMDLLGIPGFRKFVAALPKSPRDAIREMLLELNVPRSAWSKFLLCETFSAAGWASYVRYQVRESELSHTTNDDLVGFLAMRLAYDVALSRKPTVRWPLPLWPDDAELHQGLAAVAFPQKEVLGRYLLQVATEQHYQQQLLTKLASHQPQGQPPNQKLLQIVFCIDVRSEVIRRHLESANNSIETLGFAGSFGMPLEYVSLGQTTGSRQCPAMVKPAIQVHESLLGQDDQEIKVVEQHRLAMRQSRKLWKWFQSSSASCFSFVESIGLGYLFKLLGNSMGWSRPVAPAASDGVPQNLMEQLGPDIHNSQNQGFTAERRIDIAEAILRNLSLTSGFARLVAFCGHTADVTNNHYRAALDCGACCGHSGKPNARVAAALLNDPDVRDGLAVRGIMIPTDTRFLAAVHHTTTDAIEICDAHLIPVTHAGDLRTIRDSMEKASKSCGLERAARLKLSPTDDILRRSQDWAEVRPELGLAGNAAFIIAPRSRTSGVDLGGRTFLHSYDHRMDPELKVLEAIMTAPMVVTNWINMQYYASSVDPVAFGSGNKVIHNIVGQFGVLQGNGGDLMTGLPWQSVHDGKQLLHEPLRLCVVIDALRSSVETIIQRHQLVRDLVTNGWMTLTVWEGSEFHRWSAKQTWEPVSITTDGLNSAPLNDV